MLIATCPDLIINCSVVDIPKSESLNTLAQFSSYSQETQSVFIGVVPTLCVSVICAIDRLLKKQQGEN